MANDLVVSKQKIAEYVHDATDVEKRIFTLEQAVEELEEKAEEKAIEAKEKTIKAKENRNTNEEYEIDLRHREENTEKIHYEEEPYISFGEYWKEYKDRIADNSILFTPKGIGCGAWIISFILALIVAIIADIVAYSMGTEIELDKTFGEGSALIFAIVITSVIRLIWGLILRAISNSKCNEDNSIIASRNQKRKQEYERQLACQKEYNENVAEHNRRYQQALVYKRQELDRKAEILDREAENLIRESQFYAAQAAEVRKSLEPLYSQRDKFYSVGIVPPDYRTMDCAYAFDQIFRNDLADNMREAVKIYEERVFRGEIIRGVRSLEAFMGKVSSLLTTLQADMSSVKAQIGDMNRDIVRIYEQQERQNTAMIDDMKRNYAAIESRNRELFKETQMSRYALESIRESNDKIIKYIED